MIKIKSAFMIHGHKTQIDCLLNDLNLGKLSHAYLFTGLSSIGKFTVAKYFAKRMQDLSEDYDIRLCSDIYIMDDVESIKIEQMRDLSLYVPLSFQNKFKIILIKNIERMTLEAMNSFLKMLEEPNPNVVFLLTSSDSSKILQTIISRVRIINFYPLNDMEIFDFAKNLVLDEQLKSKYLFWAANRIGKLLKLVNDKSYSDLYYEMDGNLKNFLLNNNLVDIWIYLEKLYEDKNSIYEFLDLWQIYIHKELLSKNQNYASFYNEILDAVNMLDSNINTKLIMENLTIKWKNSTSHSMIS